MGVMVYSTPVGASLFGFVKNRTASGDVYRVQALRVCPRVGLIEIQGWVHRGTNRRFRARFVAGGRLREVWVDAWFSTERNSVFARQFNSAVMPEVERVWREVG